MIIVTIITWITESGFLKRMISAKFVKFPLCENVRNKVPHQQGIKSCKSLQKVRLFFILTNWFYGDKQLMIRGTTFVYHLLFEGIGNRFPCSLPWRMCPPTIYTSCKEIITMKMSIQYQSMT